MKVSIIIPVIRPQNIPKLKVLIHNNAGIPRDQYEIIAEEDTERIGAPKMVKKLTKKARSDLVMFIGDDCEPLPNFLSLAIETMGQFQGGWGLVGLNDLERPGEHAPAHWLAHKRLLDFCKEFFHTGYIHQYCDNELYMWATFLKRYRLNSKAKIKHNHIGFSDKTKTFKENIRTSEDQDMKRVYSVKAHNHDKHLFDRRKKLIVKATHKCIPMGMRSGSSMLTGSLDLMGMYSGATVVGDIRWNAKGHYENMAMIRINMKILKIFGCSFEHPDLPRGFEDDPRLDHLYDEAYKIKKFVIKHPISMATLAFWNKAFTVLPVFINRNSEAVTLSLLKKHHIPVKEGRRIWREYVNRLRNEVERGINMVEFKYEDYIKNPVPYIKKTFEAFDLLWMYDESKEDELREFVDPGLKHN